MPQTMLYFLDMFGVAVFAVSGALVAGRCGMDVFGVLVVSAVTAIGGGTVRDVLLDRHPVFWISDPNYLAVIVVSAAAVIAYARFMPVPEGSLLIADAFGLAVFTAIGARAAEEAGVPTPIVVLMAVVTGAAGGVVRDLLCGRVPLILRTDLYASASLAGATVYVLLQGAGLRTFAVPAAVAAVFALRLAAIRYGLRLPAFPPKARETGPPPNGRNGENPRDR
jgi:uncharacterized membrane protein YeiH